MISKFFVFALFSAVALARVNEQVVVRSQIQILKDDEMAVQQSHIDAVNSDPESTWKAKVNNQFVGWTVKDAKKLMGARTEGIARMTRKTFPVSSTANPTAFDWRKMAPHCVGPVLDQGHCGSCWAFGAAESLSDRFCIHSNGTVRVALSEQNVVSCDQSNNGCDGGDLSAAWDYMQSNGVVTQACSPYLSPGCNPTPCLPPFQNTPACNRTCDNGAIYTQDKHFAASSYSVGGWFSRVKDIETEIMTNGPVEAAFTVYQDFLNYNTGVYQHKTGGELGGHAIKIIGWGTSGTLQYWIVQNSWNTHWAGLGGYFWIKKGTDECGIESNVVAGLPKLN